MMQVGDVCRKIVSLITREFGELKTFGLLFKISFKIFGFWVSFGFSRSMSTMEEDIYNHPGNMEDLHKKAKDIFPTCFDGIRFQINKALSNHFQITHSITLDDAIQSSYRFGTTYVGCKKSDAEESFPLLLGDIDSSGNLNAAIFHQLSKSIKLKYVGQFLNLKSQSSSQFQLDYNSQRSSFSVGLANISISKGSGLIIFQHLKAVSRRLALGGILATQFSPDIPGNELTVLALAARFSLKNHTLASNLNNQALNITYHLKVTDYLQFGCEYNVNFDNNSQLIRAAYQCDLQQSNFTFRGMIDSKWNIGAAFDKKIGELPFYLTISSTFNHLKQTCKVGCGFVIK